MPASLVFESLHRWPLVAALGAVLTVGVLWLYPAQIRGAGLWKWLPPLLRWTAAATLAASLLKPVVLRPKSAEQWGAVVFLVDCSKSMSVVDPGRTPAERVALAGALGRLPAGVRSEVVSSLAADIERVEARGRDVVNAQSDLDYARVSGRGIANAAAHAKEQLDRYQAAAATLAARSDGIPSGADLPQRLKDFLPAPAAGSRDAWADEVKRKVEKVRAAARAFQLRTDEQLYASDAGVRASCDAVSRLSRLELSKEVMLRPGLGLVARLGKEIPAFGFAIDRGLSPLALTNYGRPVADLALVPGGKESDLTAAVTTAVNGLSKRPVRAVVLLSDGRQVGGRGDVISALRPTGVPVFTIGVAAERTPDLALYGVSLPATSSFAGETIEGEAEVTDDGGIKPPTELHVTTPAGEQVEPLTPRVRRDRREHGRSWAARFVLELGAGQGAGAQPVDFSVPQAAGEATFANNRIRRWIKVSANKLKVAACTAAPTWDFQYLRAELSRRPWVQLESRVLDPEHPKLALTAQQILEQDVLILCDVPVGALNVNQWDAVRTLVTSRGGSVVLVAGTTYAIADYAQQPIARTLLPFHDVRPAWKQWPGEQPAFHFAPTPAGERAALRLGEAGDVAARRWQELPAVFRYLQIPDAGFYPDVQRLLLESESRNAILTERRLGAGKVLFFGLNETWRWRRKSGERDADRFWRQLIRYAAGEPYAVSRGTLSLDLDKVSAQPGEAVHVRARVRGGKFPSPSAGSCPIEILRDGKPMSSRALAATGGGHFAGPIADLPEGDYEIRLRGNPRDVSDAVRVPLHVAESDEAEMRDVCGDAALLARIAKASGGQYLPVDEVDRLPERLDALHETESQFTRQPLWNSPLLFAFVLACFAGEWTLRKRLGLA